MTAVFTIYSPSGGTWNALGTLDHVTTAKQSYPLNEIGEGSLSMPASSAGASLIAYDRLVVGVDGDQEICSFIVTKIKVDVTPSGAVVNLSGPDLMHELTRYNLGTDVIDNGYGRRAEDDLAQIIYYMPGFLGWEIRQADWDIYQQTGTKHGSYLPAANESVFQMLRRCAEQSGEAFRIQPVDGNQRVVGWMSYPPWAGGAYLKMPTDPLEWESEEFEAVGMVVSCYEETDYQDLATSAYVFGAGMGETRITIAKAQGYVYAPPGWTIDWVNSLIITDQQNQYRTQYRRQKQFSNIRPQSYTEEDQRSASIALVNTAIAWLNENSAPIKSWKLEVRIRSNIRPGSLIPLDNIILHGKTIIQKGSYYAKDVVQTYNKGIRTTTVTLADRYTAPRPLRGERAIVQQIEQMDQTVRHASAYSSTSGGGGIQQHDELLGRTDPQNHPQYLLTNGGRTMTGNLGLMPGVKIDGMDPSAHQAQPNAHHNWPLQDADIPATIARASQMHGAVTLAAGSDPILTLNGQELRLGDVTTQAEFNDKINQDLRTSASPNFVDLALTNGLLLRDRTTSALYRLFLQDGKIYLEAIS